MDDQLKKYAIEIQSSTGENGYYKGIIKRKSDGLTKIRISKLDHSRIIVYKSKNRALLTIKKLKAKFGNDYRYEAVPWPRINTLGEGNSKPVEKFTPHKKWICSKTVDDETWSAGEFFDFKFQAIQAAKSQINWHNKGKRKLEFEDILGYVPDDNEQIISFAVGQCIVPKVSLDFDWMIETIQDDLCDRCGEIAEDYLADVTDEHKAELQGIFSEWLERHDYKPGFYSIRNTERIMMNEEMRD
ncbi:hypothetical protein [Enterococcus sp. DIV0800]|uniref:hypothetical protein n=1 Tax=unclassified Enterococcus TaxID=2608891 RepID=UPI003D301168